MEWARWRGGAVAQRYLTLVARTHRDIKTKLLATILRAIKVKDGSGDIYE